MSVNIVWLIAWFVVGMMTFQVYGIKKSMTTISFLFSILSLLLLVQESNQIVTFINSMGLDLISGVFTSLAYLIGANISRFVQFGTMSPMIIKYVLVLVFLWIVLF